MTNIDSEAKSFMFNGTQWCELSKIRHDANGDPGYALYLLKTI